VIGSLVNQEAWVEQAICSETDPEMFFPNAGESNREAKRVCYGCPVRAECLRFALENGEAHGVWGGFSDRERKKMRPGRRTSHCANDHEYAVTGRNQNGTCPECARQRNKRYWRNRTRGL
jgi:hypothetical protein